MQLFDVAACEVISGGLGDVTKLIKRGDRGFHGIEEAYFSTVFPGVVKGWTMHKQMHLNLFVVAGRVLFYVKPRLDSLEVESLELSASSAIRLHIAPGTWFAFEGLEDVPSKILNLASHEHRPDEMLKAPFVR